MALTPQIQTTQSAVRSVAVQDETVRVTQSVARTIFNIPTETINVTQAKVRTTYNLHRVLYEQLLLVGFLILLFELGLLRLTVTTSMFYALVMKKLFFTI
jgi:hypothetical protein